jgi:diguanylate cyclase (GGDEF)-like protein
MDEQVVAPPGPGPSASVLAASADGTDPGPATLATALAVSPTPVLLLRLQGSRATPVWATPSSRRALGGSPRDAAALAGLRWTAIGADDDPEDPLGHLLVRGGGRQDMALHRRDGSSVHVRVHAFPLDEVTPTWVAYLEELTEVRRATEQLQASEARMRALAAQAPIGIFASEAGLRLGFVNQRAAELLGRDVPALLSTGWMDAIDERDLPAVVEALAGTLALREVDLVLRPATEAPRWLRLRAGPVDLPGHGVGFIGSLEDVTAERAHQDALAYQALHDPLTGLPNRAALRSEIDGILLGRRDDDDALALLFFDLDHFKIVNDSLGHAVGDALLVEVARRLQERARHGDMLARFGGDEFVLLCPGVGSTDLARRIAERMLGGLEAPIPLEGRAFRAGASVGIVVAEVGETTAEALLRDADVAMYQAKARGRGRVEVFDSGARARAEQRLQVVTDLRRALAEDELALAYQPIHDLGDGAMLGAEALLRWRHAEAVALPIPDLISLAEETGLILELGTWVIERACADLAALRADGPDPAWVSVNLAAAQLGDVRLPEQLLGAVARHGLRPADLCLELTEHAIGGPEVDPALLAHLRGLGFRVAIDDFGTGRSSLAQLKALPVDIVKIAGDFIAGVAEDPRDAAIVEAVVGLAEVLDVTVVAEGVETAEQLAVLLRLRCPAAQGHLLGRPGPPAALHRRADDRADPLADPTTDPPPPDRPRSGTA